MMKRVATLTTILLLCMSLYAHAATVTELLGLAGVGGTTGGGCTSTGSGDCISNSFTPTAGDTVVLAIAFQNTSTVSVTTSGYTWDCSTITGAFTGVQLCWAFSVPSGAKTFTTSELLYNGINYVVMDVSGLNGTQDQSGSAASQSVATASATAVASEIGITAVSSGSAQTPITPESGWTAFTEVNQAAPDISLDVDYNANLGATGVKTGGYTNNFSGNPAAQIATFEPTATSVIGAQLQGPTQLKGPTQLQ